MSDSFGRPGPDEYAPFYAPYIAAVPDGDVVALLESQIVETAALLRATPEDHGTFRYHPGKWSINDVVGHLADSERVFTYRALRFARGDRTALPGFEQDDYVAAAGADGRSLHELADELEVVRRSSVAFFRSLDLEAGVRRGGANGHDVTVRALAYITAGHERHHVRVLRERYGVR